MNNELQNITLDLIDEPPEAMRSTINRDDIFDLTNDIRKNGLINPITVRPIADRFEVVAGHRRLLAHRYGGLPTIRCIVRELDDEAAFAVMTSENLAREDVNPVDEASHTKRLYDKAGGDLSKTMSVLNRSREWVTSRLVIAVMSDDLKDALRTAKIKIGVAVALAGITNDADRATCLGMAISQGASTVVAQYWLAQWRAGLFGTGAMTDAAGNPIPLAPPPTVMLRCSIDGKEYPASDMRSVLIYKDNIGYITAMREHLNTPPVPDESGDSAPPTEPTP